MSVTPLPPPTRDDLARMTALPVEPREHPFFYRTPRWRWWRGLVGLVLGSFLALLSMGFLPVIGMVLDGADFAAMAHEGKITLGPWGFLFNNLGLALCIPISMLTQRIVTGQRGGWLSSVQGRFRWGWFARCLAVCVPIWLVMLGVEFALGGFPPDMRVRDYTVLMIVGIVLTTPLQSAGEEYLIRGLEQRLVASYFQHRWLGWAIATLISSLTFMTLHGAADPWLNAFYLAFGAVASFAAWRTGGLEAAVAIHATNNVLSEAFLPFIDFSGMFDRSVGKGDASVLFNILAMSLAAGLLVWMGKRATIATATAPGQADVDAAVARAQQYWSAQQALAVPPPGASMPGAAHGGWQQPSGYEGTPPRP